MDIQSYLHLVKSGQDLEFQDTIQLIHQHYLYTPTAFSNGLHEPLLNPAGTNEGSCKIFAFGKLHDLTMEQTLSLFGSHYKSVLSNPYADDHQNIRRFMQDGWAGIQFDGEALKFHV